MDPVRDGGVDGDTEWGRPACKAVGRQANESAHIDVLDTQRNPTAVSAREQQQILGQPTQAIGLLAGTLQRSDELRW